MIRLFLEATDIFIKTVLHRNYSQWRTCARAINPRRVVRQVSRIARLPATDEFVSAVASARLAFLDVALAREAGGFAQTSICSLPVYINLTSVVSLCLN